VAAALILGEGIRLVLLKLDADGRRFASHDALAMCMPRSNRVRSLLSALDAVWNSWPMVGGTGQMQTGMTGDGLFNLRDPLIVPDVVLRIGLVPAIRLGHNRS